MLPTYVDLFPPIPPETANAALLVIRNGNFYLSVGRRANNLFSELDLMSQSSEIQIPGQILAILYLVTIFQFSESLSDREANRALQNRVDWKYALHLPLQYGGLPTSQLCLFRQFLLSNSEGKLYLKRLLLRLAEVTQAEKKYGICKPNTEIAIQVCWNNHLSLVWFTIKEVLRVLAIQNPVWLGTIYQPHWYQRYEKSSQIFNFSTQNLRQTEIAQEIGNDGAYLLKAISASNLADIQALPEISILNHVIEEQFILTDDTVMWRTIDCSKCNIPAYVTQINPSRILNEEVNEP